MYCPFCHHEETKVIDSRLIADGAQVKRRRQCGICQERFTTFETAELDPPLIIKRDGRREAFSMKNLRTGMLKALEKRPIHENNLDTALMAIMLELRHRGDKEITSRAIGELVMHELYKLDHIAYVRFASVYRRFQDVNDFQQAINEINDE